LNVNLLYIEETVFIKAAIIYQPNVTYYINIATLYVYDTESDDTSDFSIEAESGTLGSLWTIVEDESASDGKYIEVPNNGQSQSYGPGAVQEGIGTYNFTVSASVQFTLYVRGAADNASDDSFHYKIDDGDWITINGPLNHVAFGLDEIDRYICFRKRKPCPYNCTA
jgi:hypothetical protein